MKIKKELNCRLLLSLVFIPLLAYGDSNTSTKSNSDICIALAEVAGYLAIKEKFGMAEEIYFQAYEECDEPLFLFQSGSSQAVASGGKVGFERMRRSLRLMDDGVLKRALMDELEALERHYKSND